MNDRFFSPIEFARIQTGARELVLYLSTYKMLQVPAVFATSIEDGLAFPYGNLSVNLFGQGLVLPPWHISVKTWGENDEFAQTCFDCGVFARTDQSWDVPFGSAEIWRMLPGRMPALVALQISQQMRWPIDADSLIELAARLTPGDSVEVALDAMTLRARIVHARDAVVFEHLDGHELTCEQGACLDNALAQMRFDLNAPHQGPIYRGLHETLNPATRAALAEATVQALSSAEAPPAFGMDRREQSSRQRRGA